MSRRGTLFFIHTSPVMQYRLGVSLSTSTGLLQAAQFSLAIFFKGGIICSLFNTASSYVSDSAVSEDALIESHPRAARSTPRLG